MEDKFNKSLQRVFFKHKCTLYEQFLFFRLYPLFPPFEESLNINQYKSLQIQEYPNIYISPSKLREFCNVFDLFWGIWLLEYIEYSVHESRFFDKRELWKHICQDYCLPTWYLISAELLVV